MGGISEGGSDWIVIGISGVTCGGKTTLANRLLETITSVAVFNQDAYFLPDDSPKHVQVPGLKHNNYDILSALDMEAMHRDVLSTLSGAARPPSSPSQSAVHPQLTIPGKKILILEGFTVLNYKPLYDLCHLRYYFVLEYGECISRRILRVYDPPDVPGYFERCVWPEYERHRDQLEKDPLVTILCGSDSSAYDRVINDLRPLGARRV